MRLRPEVSYLVSLLSSVIDLVDTVDVFPIVDDSSYSMATSFMGWYIMKYVD